MNLRERPVFNADNSSLEYNTQKPDVILKEYGRVVQDMAKHLLAIEDIEKRTEMAFTLIEVMRHFNPVMREGEEYDQKLWDHLYYITNYQLEVNSPYPIPETDIRNKKPLKVDYPKFQSKYRNYGENLENLVKVMTNLGDIDQRKGAINYLGKLMKSYNHAWTKDFVDDDILLKHMENLSDGQFAELIEKMKEDGALDFYVKVFKQNGPSNSSSSQKNHRQQGKNFVKKKFKKKRNNF